MNNPMRLPIYLDYMATTPVDPRVVQKMNTCLDMQGNFGNPSSQHFYGFAASEAVENSRQEIANSVGANIREIVFTSGATESDNLAIKGAAYFYQRKGKHIVTCKTEHKAVLDTCNYLESKGFEVTYLDPEKDGLIDLKKLEDSLRDDTILVSIMHVNNEIGVIQNIAAIGDITRSRGIIFHVDAAQSIGKVAIDLQNLKVDLMSFASHKVYGPKGIGALYVSHKPRIHLEPLIHGGEQEQHLRSGTLPTHQIVGMAEAFRIANEEIQQENERIVRMREHFWQEIKTLGDVYLNGSLEKRVAHNLNISFGGVEGETLLLALKDLAVSTGAACTSATMEPSYVLQAIGVKTDLAYSSIRFSFGRFTTAEEIEYAISHIKEIVTKLRKMAPTYNGNE